jgi:O-antigen/teichoic acid export membrane protein
MHHYGQSPQPGPLGKLFALVAGAILLIVGFLFSVVFLAIVAVAGLAVWTYFWWKTRKLRQAMRERPPGGQVIEGEVVVVDESQEEERSTLPRDPPVH